MSGEPFFSWLNNDGEDPSFPVQVLERHKPGPGRVFDRHSHAYLHFFYLVAGSIRISCESGQYELAPGEVLLINSGEFHYGECAGREVTFRIVRIDVGLLVGGDPGSAQARLLLPVARSLVLFRNDVRGDAAIRREVLDLLAEHDRDAAAAELGLLAHAYALLALLLRSRIDRVIREDERDFLLRKWAGLRAVFAWLDENCADPFSLSALAGRAGMSPAAFCRAFRAVAGCSPLDYCNRLRLGRAAELLADRSLSVTEVAYRTGFNDSAYFARAFRKARGMSPSEYRRGMPAISGNRDDRRHP